MKILNLMYSKNPSAAAVHMIHTEISKKYTSLGHQVDTMYLIGDGKDSLHFNKRHFKNRGWKKLLHLAMRKQVKQLIKANNYDVILCDGVSAMGSVAHLSTGESKIRFIAVMHGYVSLPTWLIKELQKKGGQWQCVGVSELIGEYLQYRYSEITRLSFKGINNGLDFNAISTQALSKSEAREILGISPQEFVIGAIARLEREKEPEVLLRAFAEFYRQNQTGVLLMIGSGNLLDSLKILSASLGIEQRVIFTGFTPNASKFLSAFNLYVAASRHEGLSISVLEAIACKIPVICSDIPAFQNVIADKAARFSAGDQDAILHLICEVFNHPDKFNKAAEDLYSEAKNKFSIEKMLTGYAELLNV